MVAHTRRHRQETLPIGKLVAQPAPRAAEAQPAKHEHTRADQPTPRGRHARERERFPPTKQRSQASAYQRRSADPNRTDAHYRGAAPGAIDVTIDRGDPSVDRTFVLV